VQECDLLQGMSHHVAEEFGVRSFTFKDDAKSNDGVSRFLLRDLVYDKWNLECARNATQTNPGVGRKRP
jgi:hypothetical protein